MKFCKNIFLITLLLVTLATFSFANTEEVEATLNKEIIVTSNNEIQEFQNAKGERVYPISYKGTTFLPIRSISSLFKSKIKWEASTNSIYLGEGELDISSSKSTTSFTKGNNETIKAKLNQDIKIYHNNKIQTFTDASGKPVYPISYNGTTYLPVRAVSNLFNLKIDWNGENKTVMISNVIICSIITQCFNSFYIFCIF